VPPPLATTIFPGDRVTVVGVVNATPDSFSDGGRFVRGDARVDVGAAVDAVAALVAAGAHVIDVGGESTRPGSRAVPAVVEMARAVPIVEAVAKRLDVAISIDTRKAEVAEAALEAGASVVNDVSGLGTDASLGAVVARTGATLVVGHLRGTPETMQRDVRFGSALDEVTVELERSLRLAGEAGVARDRLVADPGIGFGKQLAHNLALLAGVGSLKRSLGVPVLLGPSRKAFLAELGGGERAADRDPATRAVCAVAAFAGADAVRVHDVAGVALAVRLGRALRDARPEQPS
jgi:dihydropteroate synthase